MPIVVFNTLTCMYTSDLCQLADCCVVDFYDSRFEKPEHIFRTKKVRSFMEHRKQRQNKLVQVERQQIRRMHRQNKFENFELHYIFGAGEGAELSCVC